MYLFWKTLNMMDLKGFHSRMIFDNCILETRKQLNNCILDDHGKWAWQSFLSAAAKFCSTKTLPLMINAYFLTSNLKIFIRRLHSSHVFEFPEITFVNFDIYLVCNDRLFRNKTFLILKSIFGKLMYMLPVEINIAVRMFSCKNFLN